MDSQLRGSGSPRREAGRVLGVVFDDPSEVVDMCLVVPATAAASCPQEALEWTHYFLGRLAQRVGPRGMEEYIDVSGLTWAPPLTRAELVREYFAKGLLDDLACGVYSLGTGFRMAK
jgi:hypothetical protein